MSVILQKDFHQIYGPGRPPCAGSPNYTFAEDIHVLTALADHFKVKRCLEIGVNTGATAAAMLAGNTTIEEYTGLDLPAIWFNDGNKPAGHLALADPRFRLKQLEHGSRDIRAGDIEPQDFIFIDGAHDYASVKYDTELAHVLLAPGGIIAWHDYRYPTNPDVEKLLIEINDKPGVPLIVSVQGTYTCYKIMDQPEAAKQITAANDAALVEDKSDAEQPTEPQKRKRRAKQPDAEPAGAVAEER